MNRMLKTVIDLLLIYTLVSFVMPHRAYAYLDPGSGSYLIQIVIASIAGFGYLVKANWAKIKNTLSNKGVKEAKNENKDKSS